MLRGVSCAFRGRSSFSSPKIGSVLQTGHNGNICNSSPFTFLTKQIATNTKPLSYQVIKTTTRYYQDNSGNQNKGFQNYNQNQYQNQNQNSQQGYGQPQQGQPQQGQPQQGYGQQPQQGQAQDNNDAFFDVCGFLIIICFIISNFLKIVR